MNDHASRFRFRRQGVSRQHPDGSWSVFLMRITPLPDLLVDLLQKIASDLNKSTRELFLNRTISGHEC
jgi:hypothetical protein